MQFAGLATHQNIIKSAMQRMGARVMRRHSAPDIQVSFLGGRQNGAKRTLSRADLCIGASESCDLVVLDPLAADKMVSVEFSRSVFGIVAQVTAHAEGLRVNDEPLPAGTSIEAARLPLALGVGDTRITLADPNWRPSLPAFAAPAPKAKVDDSKAANAGVTIFNRVDPIILLACAALLVLLFGSIFGSNTAVGQYQTARVLQQTQTAIPVSQRIAGRDWVAELEAQAGARNLRQQLNIRHIGDGIIEVRGDVATAAMPDFRALQTWFDGQADAPTIVWDITRSAGLPEMPRIGMVLMSEPARLILASGETVRIGEELANGWVLESVSNGDFVLARGTEQATVPLTELLP